MCQRGIVLPRGRVYLVIPTPTEALVRNGTTERLVSNLWERQKEGKLVGELFGIDWVQVAAFVWTSGQIIGAIIAIPLFIFIIYNFIKIWRRMP